MASPAFADEPAPAPTPTLSALIASASAARLADDPVWRALIHHSHGRFTLPQSGLLLGGEGPGAADHTPARELALTLELLLQQPAARCRYPARHRFLSRHLPLPQALDVACPELDEFVRRVPADRIGLAFVAENIEHPASVMGHLFLKVAGDDATGELREHAISFFTDPIGLNFPLYLYRGMVAGMPGYFSLTPYRQHLHGYVHGEQRTLWEYDLSFSPEERELVKLHLLELKGGRYEYLFSRYNCATLVLELLAVARPELLDQDHAWVSPKEVVRIAQRHRLIGATAAVLPAPTAAVIYAEQLAPSERRRVRDAVAARKTAAADLAVAASRQVVANNLALAHNEQLLRTGRIDQAEWQRWQDAFMATAPALDIGFDAASRYNPAVSSGELRATAGWRFRAGQPDRLALRWLPVSHQIDDDNRGYLTENELKLFEVALWLDEGRKLRLDALTLFSSLSLQPYDRFSNTWSSSFEIALRTGLTRDLRERLSLDVSIGRGLTWRVQQDIDLWGMVRVGAQLGRRSALVARPQIGVVVRQVYGMKAVLSWEGRGTADRAETLKFVQALHLGRGDSIKLGWQQDRGRGAVQRTVALDYMHVF